MGAVFKREFKAFFTSPIGYYCCGWILLQGFFLFNKHCGLQPGFISCIRSLFPFILIILPLVTMRLFSEEKRQKPIRRCLHHQLVLQV